MKKCISVLVFSLFLLAAQAQKVVNDLNAETRTVTPFHAISIASSFEVLITQGNEEGLAVSSTEKDDMQYIKTSVDNGVLKIDFDNKKKWWPKGRKLKAYISVKNIDMMKISGASKVKIDGAFKAPVFKLWMSGASKLQGQLDVDGPMNANLSGASDMEISGSAKEIIIDANGASDVRAYNFTTGNCTVAATGASSVRITVNNELNARLSGASSVSYKGKAIIKDIRTSGASKISRES